MNAMMDEYIAVGNRKERDHLRDLSVNGKVVLILILKE
jgi:hypothetical protein